MKWANSSWQVDTRINASGKYRVVLPAAPASNPYSVGTDGSDPDTPGDYTSADPDSVTVTKPGFQQDF
jgi:hypothetical protein